MLRNHTLAALSEADMHVIRPHLSQHRVQRGEVLTAQGADVRSVYFPATAYLANVVTFNDGGSAQTFIMGAEGVSGLAAFLADEPCAWSVEVRSDGEVYALPAAVLRRQVEASPYLRQQLLRRVYDYQAQAAFAVGCAALHDVRSRLALAILSSADRLGTRELRFTQQDLAELLGAQRTTVTAAAMALKATGAIEYRRGKLRIIDRHALKHQACECYERRRAFQAPASESGHPDLVST